MGSSFLVLDTETIPDVRAYARILHLPVTTPPAEVVAAWEAAKRPFKPLLQQIVAVACAWISDTGALQRIGALTGDEAQMVADFFGLVAAQHPILVGWNTSGYDLPVLATRAAVHGLAIGSFYPWGYTKRYAEDVHKDLMDLQTHFQSRLALKLDEAAALFGVPGKLDLNGAGVWDTWCAGDEDHIRRYCCTDVLTTAWVFARLAPTRGWWTPTQAATFEASARAWLAQHSAAPWPAFRAALAELEEGS